MLREQDHMMLIDKLREQELFSSGKFKWSGSTEV